MQNKWRALCAYVLALPYRIRLGSLGARPRLYPPVLVSGGRYICLGDDAHVGAFAALSVAFGGRILVGAKCEIGCFTRIEADTGSITMGHGCSVNPFCLLNGYGGLTIGNEVRIASHSVILSSTHRHKEAMCSIQSQGIEKKETVIEDDVWIGSHSVIIGGVRVGAHSIIGAGSIVLADVPTFAVVAGAPARVIRMRNV